MIEELRYKFAMFNRAYELAQEAHAGQKRSDGKDYMSHIDAVILNVIDVYLNEFAYLSLNELFEENITTLVRNLEATISLAALHDSVEDNTNFTFEKIETELLSFINKNDFGWKSRFKQFIEGLKAISKKEKGVKLYETYTAYVKVILNNYFSRMVKIADLKHNLSDLKSGSLKDKYELTLYILEKRIL